MIKSTMVKGKFIFLSFIIGVIVLFSQDSLLSVSQKEAIEKALSDINKAPDFTLKAINIYLEYCGKSTFQNKKICYKKFKSF